MLPHLMFTIAYEVAFSPFTLLMRKTEESVVMQLVSGGVPVCLTPKPKFFLYNLPAPITLCEKYEKSVTNGEFKGRARAPGLRSQSKLYGIDVLGRP